jgi:hypothetical protein
MGDAAVAHTLFSITDLGVWLAEWRDAHRAGGAGSGRFARQPRGLLDGYSCADFTVIDYTGGPWPPAPSEHDVRVNVLQGFQSAESGLFELVSSSGERLTPPGAGVYETTAYFVAALELLGARPMQPLRALDNLRTPEGIGDFLEGLHWSAPRAAAGGGAGVAGCFAVTGDVGPEWFQRYFDWLDAECDPATGFWRRGVKSDPIEALGGAYQFYTVYDRLRRPMPHPRSLVTACVELQRTDFLYKEDGPGWTELCAAFILDRAFRQSGARYRSVVEAFEGLARVSAERMADEPFREKLTENPHKVAAILGLAALLSGALPGSVKSEHPLRFYADRLVFV